MNVQVHAAFVAVLIAAAHVASAGAAPVQTGPEVPAASAAVVALVVGEGVVSGLVAEPGLVLTSLHALGGRHVVGVRLPGGSTALGQVVWSSAESDLVMVRLPRGSGGSASLPSVSPGQSASRDRALVLFHSAEAGVVVTQAVRLVALGNPDRTGALRPQPALGPEHLGAAVVDDEGQFVGIVARPRIGGAQGEGPLVVATSRVRAEMARAEAEGADAGSPARSTSGTGGAGDTPSTSPARRRAAEPPDDPSQESDLDRERREGAERLEREVARLAPLRDRAARAAAGYAAECEGQYVPVLGGSPNWPYPGGVIAKADLPECRALSERAAADREQLRQRLDTAQEGARRSGVYPGTIRDILARHGFGSLDLKR